jgi:hypothetical protein
MKNSQNKDQKDNFQAVSSSHREDRNREAEKPR